MTLSKNLARFSSGNVKLLTILLLIVMLPFLTGCTLEFSKERIQEIASDPIIQKEIKSVITSLCFNITTQINNNTYHRTVRGFEC